MGAPVELADAIALLHGPANSGRSIYYAYADMLMRKLGPSANADRKSAVLTKSRPLVTLP